MSIILDVRSGERNDSSTGLCLRVVDGSVIQRDGRFERVGRDLYEIGGEGVGSYALIASGDGEIGVESVSLTFTEFSFVDGFYYYLTNSRTWLSSVRDEVGGLLEHFYGGTVVRSVRADLSVGVGEVGGLFWWTRNDESRVRFSYENRGWSLLRGGAGVVVGVVGSEDEIVAGLEGELRVGGSNVGDASVSVYEIGGVDFPLYVEGSEPSEILTEGMVLSPSGKVLFKGDSVHVGKEVFYVSGTLGGFESNEVLGGGYLSPKPRLNEYPLLRVAGYGYSRIEFVEAEDDLGLDPQYGVVRVALDSGRILSSSPVIYDGLVLCDAPIGQLEVVNLLMDVPDGSGLEPSGVASSFRPTGVGLKWDYRWERLYVRLVEAGRTLPVELVDKLPKRLSVHRGYLVRGTETVVLSSAWSGQTKKIFSGHVALSRGGLRHMSILGLSGKSGSFRVDGSVVSFTGEQVVGAGVSVVGGHLVVDVGSVVDHPENVLEFESLRSIGLVPDVDLETGLEFVLTRSEVKGYYSFDEERVGDISGSSTFQFLQFEPRVDFSGYGVNEFFKVGDKILGELDIEPAFGSSPNGFHWIGGRTVTSKITQETSRLALGPGLRVGTTSLTITQEQTDGSVLTQSLTEGVDYDLPSDGLEGQARLINRLGSEVVVGQKQGVLVGNDLDLPVDLSLVRAGDFFYDGLNYFKIEGITGSVITLSSTLGLQRGRWKIYRGYREGVEVLETPDPTKIVGEILDDLSVKERDAVEVYKVYSGVLAFDKVMPSSRLFIRKTEGGVEITYPLDVLRDEVLSSPYELSGDHYTSGSYRIKVEGVEYESGVMIAHDLEDGGVEHLGFTVVNDRVVFEKNGVSDSSWVVGEVVFVRKPRVLVDRAEMDLNLNLESPFTPSNTFDDFLELLASPRVEPTSGAISFEDPLEVGVGVEVSYTPVDDIEGGRVIEAMGFNTVQEEAVKVNDYEFTYNPLGKEVELEVTPTVFVGAEKILSSLYTIDENKVRFTFEVTASVKVSYTTLSSNGGDASVRTSSGMYVPKYKIDKGSTTLTVHRDLSSTLGAGDLIRVGTQIFNVVSVSSSSITLDPPARVNLEAEEISFLNVPSFTYDGVTSSYAFRQITGANVTSKPKSPDILLQGDYRDFIKASSLVVLQGTPYRVKVVGLDDTTGMTKVTIEGFTTGHDFISTNDFHVSFRPVLIEGDKSLTLSTGLVDTYEYQLIKFDHGVGRGRLLTEGDDYRLNSEAGLIDLVNGHVISPQVSYYLLHTALSGVKPFTLLGGRVSNPVYKASFNQSRTPTEYDGLGLNVSCVVSSPDTFQVRIADEDTYSSEIANELQQSINQSTGSGGKFVITSPTSQGKAIGVYDLLANDVVARSRISLYNGYVQPVDDIISTTTGKVVGDADGSFKFNLLTAGDWIAPGMEDHITREIYPRYVSMEFLTPLNPANPFPLPSDAILIGGTPPEAKALASILEKQKPLIENEMDDFILIGQKERTSFDLSVGFPYIKMDYDPIYSPMWKRNRFSRLYPTSTRMYSYRTPGTLDTSTNGITIANVKNEAMGQIENITSLPVVKRRPARFRVYDFSLKGYPSVAGTVGKPTLILSAVSLDEFPIDNATGLPDTTQLVSEGGEIADVVLGNVDRTFNGLQIGGKVSLSRSGGEFYNVMNTAETATLPDLGLFPPLDLEAPRNAKVEAIIDGCYVVLEGNVYTLKINDESLVQNPPKRGDTLIESFARDVDDDTSPTTTFRVGSDIGLKASTGELVDISLPSASDPDWPIKEIVGQNVPGSGLALEGDVDFLYQETTPFRYPALDGEALDDTGDESIPYKSRFSERDLLPQIPPSLNGLQVQTLNAISGVNEYVYPDEARGLASIATASLTTNEDFSVLNGVCEQVPRQGDLVVLKPDPSNVAGCASTGVLELAEMNGSELLVPAYTTQGLVKYSVLNMITEINGDATQGVLLTEQFNDPVIPGTFNESQLRLEFNTLQAGIIQSIYDKINTDGEVIAVMLFDPITHDPSYYFYFINLGGAWAAQVFDIATAAIRGASGTLTVDPASNTLIFTQRPVPNAYLTGEVWLDYNDMESWLFENTSVDFWGSMTPISDPLTKTISSSSDGATPLYFDYSLSLYEIGEISATDFIAPNRVDLYTVATHWTTWVSSSIDANLVDVNDYQLNLDIRATFLNVSEEGGAGTHTIESDVNNSTFNVSVIDDTTLRALPLDGISRTDDPMSIFIGAEVDETDTILQGTARSGLVDSGATQDTGKGILRNINATHGSVDQIIPGDLLYIDRGHNSGTHRVLGRVETSATIETTESFGSSGLLPVVFPKIVSITDNLDNTATIFTDVDNLSDYFPTPAPGSYKEAFIIINNNYLNQPESDQNNTYDEVFAHSMVHFLYSATSSNEFTIHEVREGGDDYPHYSDGTHGGNHPTSLTLADLVTLIGTGGQTIAGMSRVPFNGLVLGYGPIPVSLDHTIEVYFNMAGGYTGTANNLNEGLIERDPLTNEVIAFNLPTQVYETVEDTPQGNQYHDTFITPGDTITLTVNVSEGIYLDTNFPQLLRDYKGTTPVEFADGSSQVRSATDSTLTNLPAWTFYEEVNFTVRRLRRFTDVFSKLIYAFEGFRYLYEQRVGLVGSVAYASGYTLTLTPLKVDGEGVADVNGTDTQVGDFSQVVSIGDQVQCFNASNQETLYLRVLEVGSTLKCSVIRGSASNVSNGDVFKVITRVPLIPELQAFDQFIEHGFTEIYSTTPQEGISVGIENVLSDTNADFISLGVAEGDFLVIDPQGLLTGTANEYGATAQGDNGDGTPGIPNELDDNRGSYKILSVDDANTLTVEFYAGDSGTARTTYKLLPSVSGDDAQPLRQTAGIVGGTYATTPDSIHPFSYRILRRNPTLGESLAGSFLFFRERTLSWVEVIRSFNQLPTQPYTWSQYEAEGLIDDVGITDRSHPSNDVLLQSILGNEASQPFENNEICLSVYDRRMLIEDPKMASEGYGTPEDGISTVLENDISSMNARDNRYAWISIRTDQVNGTLSKLSRVDLSNPDDTALEDIK